MPDSNEQLEFEYIKSPEELQEEFSERLKKRQKVVMQAFADVFNTPNGQVVLEHLSANFEERSSLNTEGNAYKTIAAEGERNVIIYIKAILKEANSNGSSITD